jgi:hypothetical protein
MSFDLSLQINLENGRTEGGNLVPIRSAPAYVTVYSEY